MREVTFVTGNLYKFDIAFHTLRKHGIKVTRAEAEIDEIQGEDEVIIAKDKAQKIYDKLQKPILVNDDSWSIPGLNGFPGPYMKSMNHWLTAEDFLRLTKPLKDRRVYLIQVSIYQDETGQTVFRKELPGVLLDNVSKFPGTPNAKITSLTKDGLSIAEVRSMSMKQLAHELDSVWNDVAEWLKEKK